MRKNICKILASFIMLSVIVSSIVFTASAAGSTISFSKQKPSVNESVTVSVTISTDEEMYGTEFSVKYNPDVLRFDGGDSASGGAGVIKVVADADGVKKKTLSLKFTAIKAGSSLMQVTDAIYASDAEKAVGGSSATLVVADVTKSDNANLKSLSLSKGTLSPKFSAAKTAYTASVPYDVSKCDIFATKADDGAKVAVSGNSNLKVGKNTRTVTVTAPSGAQKVYTVTITRLEKDETVSEPTESTVSSEPTASEEPETNPYETTVDGKNYTVATDITGIKLPNGFTAAKTEYNGESVAIAENSENNFKIYYLKGAESEEYAPYLLSENNNTFKEMQFASFGENTYIFADIPSNLKAPEGFYETTVKIGDFDVNAFAKSDSEVTDFYYLYCFFNSGFRTYCFDSKENSLQRCPDFKLVETSQDTIPKSAGFLARFNTLSSNAKIIIIGLLLAVIVAIVLIVLLILKLTKGNDYLEYDDEDIMFRGDFEDVAVSDGDENADETEEEKTEKQ